MQINGGRAVYALSDTAIHCTLLFYPMKKVLLPVLALMFFSSCSHKVYKALDWQPTRVASDGWVIDWPDPLRYIDEKTKINYDITNDLHNLYVCMRVADPTTKMKIIHGGMEFRIDTLGTKAFPIAFIYPTANEIVLARERRGISLKEEHSHDNKPQSEPLEKILSPPVEAELAGFKQLPDGTISLIKNACGISAAIEIDSLGILNYEAIIPFSTFYKYELTKADTCRVFNYAIKINALPSPQAHTGGGAPTMNVGGMGGGGGHRGGGPGGGGGGGSHGGAHNGEGGNFSGNSELYVNTSITQKFRFSVK